MEIKIVQNKNIGTSADTKLYSYENSREVRNLHESLDVYTKTPLIELKNYSKRNNIKAVLIKDEATRFGLKAFKGLGGIYAIYKIICRELGLENVSIKDLLNGNYRDKINKMTFITTTDGNHGKGVSWAAGVFGCKSFIFMPKGTVEARAQAIREVGPAEVKITDMIYDDCVKYSAKLAADKSYFLVQDTSWEGYEEVPRLIMRGYTTLIYEALEQMKAAGYIRPTHVFLQAGVGSMAGTVCAALAETFGENCPRITIVEPTEVACFYETMRVGDGRIHSATGNGKTMMAGLNCGTPCHIAWELIRSVAADSAMIPDFSTVDAIRKLYYPVGDDPQIIAGESGAAGFALANAAVSNQNLRDKLEIDKNSIILLINTEGVTDPINFQRILSE